MVWIVAAITYDIEEMIGILQMQKKEAENWKGEPSQDACTSHHCCPNWKGESLKMLVQATTAVLGGLPESDYIGEGLSIKINVEGQRLHCFKCSEKGYVHSDYEAKMKGALPQKELQNVEVGGGSNKKHSRT